MNRRGRVHRRDRRLAQRVWRLIRHRDQVALGKRVALGQRTGLGMHAGSAGRAWAVQVRAVQIGLTWLTRLAVRAGLALLRGLVRCRRLAGCGWLRVPPGLAVLAGLAGLAVLAVLAGLAVLPGLARHARLSVRS
jgi:hypothetical protein